VTIDIYAKAKYNKPWELATVVNADVEPAVNMGEIQPFGWDNSKGKMARWGLETLYLPGFRVFIRLNMD